MFIADVAHDHLAGIEFLSPVGLVVARMLLENVLDFQLRGVLMTFMLRDSTSDQQAAEEKETGADQGFHDIRTGDHPLYFGRKGRIRFRSMK